MDQFLKIKKIPKLTKKEIDDFNRPKSIKSFNMLTINFLTKKSALDVFTVNSHILLGRNQILPVSCNNR